jgi:DNA repair exonuclease SbcCD ATPase subunit
LREVLAAQETMAADVERLNVVVPVLQQQLSSLESRLQQLLDDAQTKTGMHSAAAEDTRSAEAKLLEDIRREHRLVRARFGAISRYEERMRRLEAAIEPPRDSGPEASTAPHVDSTTD